MVGIGSNVQPPGMMDLHILEHTELPPELVEKWQGVVNLIADIVKVPAALIMMVESPSIVVVAASDSKGNPYERGEAACLDTGLYCETVMRTRRRLLVPDATADPAWESNPDIRLGMISYLGFPITWPNGDVFGTICVLDAKANAYSALHQDLLLQFRDVVETDLRVLCSFDAQLAEEARGRLEESERARETLVGTLTRLQELQEGLQASQRHLEEAVRLRDEFISVASHELRTPIASLQLIVQGLTRGLVPLSPENMLRTCDVAERQVGRLTRLIEELLDVARIETGRVALDVERLDVVALVREVLQRLESDLVQARCSVALDAPAPVMGCTDRSKLERIVTNILSNAMKFGAGKPIEIAVEERPAGTVRVVVSDHGVGIAPERLPRIFERFERAVSARAYGGLGLGLYIVRSLVRELGGTVQVASELDRGARFTVEIPCAGIVASPAEVAAPST